MSVVCFLLSVDCSLTPETYLFLTPKIKRININKLNPCFVNYLWGITLVIFFFMLPDTGY